MAEINTVDHDTIEIALGDSDKPAYPVTGVEQLQGVVPPEKGGTGINALNGGEIMASAPGGQFLQETGIQTSLFNGLRGNIQNQFDDMYAEHDTYVGNIDTLCGSQTSGSYYIDPQNEATLGTMPFAETFLLSILATSAMTVQTAFSETLTFVKTRITKKVEGETSPTWTNWIDFGVSPDVKLRSYVVDVTPDNWIEIADGGWYKDIKLEGIMESDNPTINIIPKGNNATEVTAEREAYCCIGRIDTYDGLIRVFCFEQVMTSTVCIGITCHGM